MSIDTSNVQTVEQYEDPATGEWVTKVDGVETSRIAPTTERANELELRRRAELALVTNADFLALQSPSNAQVLAQVRALTKEATALIRLLVQKLDSVEGTS